MKAFVKRSATEQGMEFREMPVPEVGDTELLVRVRAIGVGVHDGYFVPPAAPYPYVIGIEAAGIVEGIGKAVTTHRPGERVAFVSAMQPKGGTWAEYAVVESRSLLVRIPDGMTFEEAAAVPVAGNTAIRALMCVDLQAEDTLFVAGGSGAIGTFAIQLATAKGYRVAASASARNHRYLESLGAEKVVDYRDPDWPEQLLSWCPGGVGAAIGIQPGTAQQSERVLRRGGTVVAVSGDRFVPERGVVLKQLPVDVDVTAAVQQLMDQVASGSIRLEIERVYPFSEAPNALAQAGTRHTRGKLVLSLGS